MAGARTVFRWLACALGVVVLLGLCTAPSLAASPVVTPASDLVPKLNLAGVDTGFATGGRNALYTASWRDDDHATITNIVITVKLPPGSGVVSTDPAVCTFSPPDPSAQTVVTCLRDNLHSGETVTQQVFFQTPTVSLETSAVVTAQLTGKEQASDTDKSHTDTFPAPERPLTIVPTAGDAAGGCLRPQEGEATLATQDGLSADNPLITEADLTGPTGQFCTPVTLVEESCGGGACITDLAKTGAPEVSAPLQLIFTFVANNRNLDWFKISDTNPVPEVVPNCLGATQLPPGLVACVNSRAKVGSMAVRLGVLWGGGPDPTWHA